MTLFLGTLWSSIKEVKAPFGFFMWNRELLCTQCRGIRPHLAARGKSHCFSQLSARTCGLFSSYYGDGLSKLVFGGEESRWQRNRTGRSLSLLQIHRKNNRTVNKFTKQLLIASSGHQAPRKAAHCLRREVGQKY